MENSAHTRWVYNPPRGLTQEEHMCGFDHFQLKGSCDSQLAERLYFYRLQPAPHLASDVGRPTKQTTTIHRELQNLLTSHKPIFIPLFINSILECLQPLILHFLRRHQKHL